MIRRLALLVVGLAAFGLGTVALVAPAAVPVRLSTLAVSAVGLVPLVMAYRAVMGRYDRPRYRARPGTPERAAGSTPPGVDLRATLSTFADSRHAPTRDGLRAFALAVLSRFDGYTTTEATEALRTGAWTADPDAVAFFADAARVRSLLGRLHDRLRPESTYRRRLRHAVDALTERGGVHTPAEPSLLAQWRARLGDIRADHDADGSPTAGDDPPFRRGGDLDDPDWPDSPWPTGHLWGVSALTLVGVGLGAIYREPALVLLGVVGVGFAALSRAATPPQPSLSLTRTLDPPDPTPGGTVEVTVTVTNEGPSTLADLRLIDGVPAGLAVLDGSARAATVLRPGARTTLTYSVDARPGEHAFDPLLAVARDATGAHETVQRVADDAGAGLQCVPSFEPTRAPLPLHEQVTASAGSVPTAGGGAGVEFHAVREYRRGDPLARIDWRRRARTGDLTTLEFRQERAASVLLLLDARAAAYLAPDSRTPHAVARSVSAAGRLSGTLLSAGDRVGLATISPVFCWLAPDTGRAHRDALQKRLTTHPSLSPVVPDPPEGESDSAAAGDDLPPALRERLSVLRQHVPARTQVLCCSPIADDAVVDFLRRLDAHGHPVTVVSPNPTATRTPGQRVARVARGLRLADLRSAGIPVVDWRADEPLDAALVRAGRWSR